MKKVQIVDIFRRIRRTIITFLSIMFVISLGVSSYLGISFAKISMIKTGNEYFNKQNFHHVQISYNYGLTKDDLQAVKKISDVDKAEGGYSTTGFLEMSGEKRLITIQSVTESLDKATIVKGRMPKLSNEIAIEEVMHNEDKVNIGDFIDIDSSNDDGRNNLSNKKFKVVGIVHHPSYTCNYVYSRRGISTKGNGNCLNYVLLSQKGFNMKVMGNDYSNIYVWSNKLAKYNCFSNEYKSKCDDLVNKILKISRHRENIRYDDISKQYNTMTKRKVIKLPKTKWSVVTRSANVSYAMYKDNADGLGKLSFSFAFIYIVVALMVCYSSISRMIGEQRYLIGAQKALGYRKWEILRQYIIYTFWCTIFGCVWGILTAYFFIENISLHSYKQIYFFNNYLLVYDSKLIVIVIFSAIFLTALATISACIKLINKPTVQLLTYEMPKGGNKHFYEKGILWSEISLFNRTIIKNLFNDKKHIITSIIGIAGCTALMIIGFTLKFAIENVNVEQFSKIQRFDVALSVYKGSNLNEFKKVLNKDSKINYISMMDRMMVTKVNKKDNIVIDLLCFDSNRANNYFRLQDEITGKKDNIPKQGVLLSSNTADYYGVKKNDVIDIVNSKGENVKVKVTGFVTNYVCNFVVISPEYYKKVFKENMQKNMFFIKLNGANKNLLESRLKKKNGYLTLVGKEMGVSIFKNISDSINSVIEILIVLSAILALVVVLNISIMYVNEKSRVLTIMRINGFTLKETKSFIAYGDIILTVLGLSIGTLLGIFLGYKIVKIIENDCVYYIHTPSLKACIISCLISIVYIFIVHKIARYRITKLPLNNVDAND